MFKLAGLFSLLVTLALEIIKYLQRRQDYDRAKLLGAAELLVKANDLVTKAQYASATVDHSDAAILSDPNNRDTPAAERAGANGKDTSDDHL